ncbi:MAG: D-alanyl-D-alanine carboxypeptidase [Propionibacteriales bacterium]|nr:D-alanyl-D-alanine carboxypeptidase [Propionibacteriales bacterium]
MSPSTFRLRGALGCGAIVAALVGGFTPAVMADGGSTVGGEALASSGLVVNAPGAGPLPRLSASSYVLADLDSGAVLAALNPHGRLRPASTLKVLTAVTLLPRLDPNTGYTARRQDANVDGSRVGIVPHATYTVHNLFEALFLVSGNDAASALANAAGGARATEARMQSEARLLGALDTTVRNTSGLDARRQFSSAYDLALFARAGLARRDFRDYVLTVRSHFPGRMPKRDKRRRSFEIYTQDRLLLNFRGAIGVKTGWTTKARGTFIGAARRGGRTLVATVMHTKGSPWEESRDLLRWGFRNASRAQPVGTLNQSGAATASTVGSGTVVSSAQVASPLVAGAPVVGDGWDVPVWVWPAVLLLALLGALRARAVVTQHRRIRSYGRTLRSYR